MRSKLNQDRSIDSILSLTVHDIPEVLLGDFMELVVSPYYRGAVNEAIIDLMRRAVRERKRQLSKLSVQSSSSNKRPEHISIQDYLPFCEYPRFPRSILRQ